MIHHLIYLSRSPRHCDDTFLISLLGVARTNNARLGVTGVLLYWDQTFLQLLEGDRDKVAQTFASIRRDRRHEGVVVLHQQQSHHPRLFPQWSMGYGHMRCMDKADIPGLEKNGLNDVRNQLTLGGQAPAARLLSEVIAFNEVDREG